jgi:hypothetical protein
VNGSKTIIQRWTASVPKRPEMAVEFDTTVALRHSQSLYAHGFCRDETVCAVAEAVVATIQIDKNPQ